MSKLMRFLALSTLVFFGCKPDDDPPIICDPLPPPSLSDFVFRVVDRNTGEELLAPGKLNPDSVRISQACNSSTSFPFRHYKGYMANQDDLTGSIDSSKVVYIFAIDSLKPRYSNEGVECEYVYLYWNNMDTDTLMLSSAGDGCSAPRVVTITFNGTVVPESDNWVTYHGNLINYYLLQK